MKTALEMARDHLVKAHDSILNAADSLLKEGAVEMAWNLRSTAGWIARDIADLHRLTGHKNEGWGATAATEKDDDGC